MYRECQLPSHLAFYHKLYYNEDEERALYDFWQKLKQSLELARGAGPRRLLAPPGPRLLAAPGPRLLAPPGPPPPPQINIVELPPSSYLNDYLDENLFLPSTNRSISMNDLDCLNTDSMKGESRSLCSVSQRSGSSDEKKKKPGKLTRILNTLKLKKPKKTIMIAH